MTRKRGPTPKVTVENSWLNKSLDERIAILRHLAPDRAEGISMLVDAVLKEEWDRVGPTPRQARDGS
jgi:hypothetical protein